MPPRLAAVRGGWAPGWDWPQSKDEKQLRLNCLYEDMLSLSEHELAALEHAIDSVASSGSSSHSTPPRSSDLGDPSPVLSELGSPSPAASELGRPSPARTKATVAKLALSLTPTQSTDLPLRDGRLTVEEPESR